MCFSHSPHFNVFFLMSQYSTFVCVCFGSYSQEMGLLKKKLFLMNVPPELWIQTQTLNECSSHIWHMSKSYSQVNGRKEGARKVDGKEGWFMGKSSLAALSGWRTSNTNMLISERSLCYCLWSPKSFPCRFLIESQLTCWMRGKFRNKKYCFVQV